VTTNIRGCRENCRLTWRYEHGGALPGGPFAGTLASAGDVRVCEHGATWVATGTISTSTFYTQHDVWLRVSRWSNRAYWKRARRAVVEDAA